MPGTPEANTPRLWVLNLDAEYELAHGPGYLPSASIARRIAPFVPLATPLLAPEDQQLHPGAPSLTQGGLGRCWSPTPSALLLLKHAGAVCPPAPPLKVLQAVNHRRFCLPLGGGAPGAHYIDSAEALISFEPQLSSGRYVFKRPFGAAGRDQRTLGGEELSSVDRNWLGATIRKGGALAESWVPIAQEYALHGLLGPSGDLTLGRVCTQDVGPRHAWTKTLAPTRCPLAPEHATRLRDKAEQVADALHSHGYFGPFGIDAYTYVDTGGHLHFNALSELNARYSMGFALGFSHLDNWREFPGA